MFANCSGFNGCLVQLGFSPVSYESDQSVTTIGRYSLGARVSLFPASKIYRDKL
jgi:hypothetical protein